MIARVYRYLALGDSYTIGEGVEADERWPVQLAAQLQAKGIVVEPPEIIAVTGWTTDELSAGIDAAAPDGSYDLVSLLIGANDQFRGLHPREYLARFRPLLRRAIELAGGFSDRVLVLSIPDWSVTPFAEGRDRAELSELIGIFNSVNWAEAGSAHARYVDITKSSQRARNRPDLLAAGGLHPSGRMYLEWSGLALPEALAALGHSGDL